MTPQQYDIYVSYAQEDRDKVRRIIEELEWVGLRVWWADQPTTSQESLQVLDEQMDATKVHLLVLSNNSAASGRLQAEARTGSAKGRLIAARIDPVLPPRGVKAITYADLTNWEGGQDHRGMKKLLHGIYRLIGKGVAPDISLEKGDEQEYESDVDQLSDPEKDERAWQMCLAYNNRTYYNHYLNHFPNGKYVHEAKERIAKKKRTGNIILTCAIIWIIAQIIFSVIINLADF